MGKESKLIFGKYLEGNKGKLYVPLENTDGYVFSPVDIQGGKFVFSSVPKHEANQSYPVVGEYWSTLAQARK